MARRHRARGYVLALHVREALALAMRAAAVVGGLLLFAGIARSLGLIH